jgi:hypothetical protein
MNMIENATVKIYIPVIAKNSEGTPTKTWGYKVTPEPIAPIEEFRADVQPARLSEADLQAYGLSNKDSDVKKMYFYQSPNSVLNNRAFILSDFPGESGIYYEIRGSNHWPIHGEALLVPVQGEPGFIMGPTIGTTFLWDDNMAWDDAQIWKDK